MAATNASAAMAAVLHAMSSFGFDELHRPGLVNKVDDLG